MKKFKIKMHKDKVQPFVAAVDNSWFVILTLIKFLDNEMVEVYVSCKTVACLLKLFQDYEQEEIIKSIKVVLNLKS